MLARPSTARIGCTSAENGQPMARDLRTVSLPWRTAKRAWLSRQSWDEGDLGTHPASRRLRALPGWSLAPEGSSTAAGRKSGPPGKQQAGLGPERASTVSKPDCFRYPHAKPAAWHWCATHSRAARTTTPPTGPPPRKRWRSTRNGLSPRGRTGRSSDGWSAISPEKSEYRDAGGLRGLRPMQAGLFTRQEG